MTEQTHVNATRRSTLKAAAVGITALVAPTIWTSAKGQSKRIVVRDDGGIYTKAYSAVYYKPFTETGIEVVGVPASRADRQIKGMVDTKNYTWDMAMITSPAIRP